MKTPLLILTAAMFRFRNERTARLISVFITGAALAAAGVFVPKLSVAALAALALSGVAIAPDALAIVRRFAGLMFPQHQKSAERGCATVCALLITGLCAYIVLSDQFGTSCFHNNLFGEVGIL